MMLNNKIFDDAYITLGIFMAIEERFNIELLDIEVQDIKTIEELVELIKQKQK